MLACVKLNMPVRNLHSFAGNKTDEKLAPTHYQGVGFVTCFIFYILVEHVTLVPPSVK